MSIKCALLGLGHMGKIHRDHLKNRGICVHFADGIADCHCILTESADFVLISTTASTHFEYVKLALEQNLDVFVEKPLALSVKEAKFLAELAQEKHRILFVGHSEKFNPAFAKFKGEFSAKAKLEKLISLKFTRHNPPCSRGLDVSAIWDIGVHDFELLFHLKQAALSQDWDQVALNFDESRDAESMERSICARFESPDGEISELSADLAVKLSPTSADAVSLEQGEFLEMLKLPEPQRTNAAQKNLESALFAVEFAESYSTIPNRPK